MRSKSFILIALTASLSFVSSAAFADPSTGPQTSAGYGAENLNGINNPFSPGRLDIKSRQIEVNAGYLQNNNGQTGGTVKLDLDKRYLIDGTVDNDGYIGFSLNPALHARLDVFGKDGEGKQVKTQVELSSITVFSAQSTSAKSYASDVSLQEAREMMRDAASIKFNKWHNCSIETDRDGYDHFNDNPAACFTGMPEDRKTWTPAQRAEFMSRQIPMYLVSTKPSTSGDVHFLSATGVYERSPLIKAETIGGKLQVLKLSGETTFRIGNQVQVDLCASGAGSVIFGRAKVGESTSAGAWETKVSGCAGVQVGKVGRVGYEAGLNHHYDFDGSQTLATYQQVSLSKIANSPIKAAWTREVEIGNKDGGDQVGGVTTNLFTAGAAF